MACPLFRQHGQRPTELWLLGDESMRAVNDTITLRQQLAPYILAQHALASKTGQPINRP